MAPRCMNFLKVLTLPVCELFADSEKAEDWMGSFCFFPARCILCHQEGAESYIRTAWLRCESMKNLFQIIGSLLAAAPPPPPNYHTSAQASSENKGCMWPLSPNQPWTGLHSSPLQSVLRPCLLDSWLQTLSALTVSRPTPQFTVPFPSPPSTKPTCLASRGPATLF